MEKIVLSVCEDFSGKAQNKGCMCEGQRSVGEGLRMLLVGGPGLQFLREILLLTTRFPPSKKSLCFCNFL